MNKTYTLVLSALAAGIAGALALFAPAEAGEWVLVFLCVAVGLNSLGHIAP